MPDAANPLPLPTPATPQALNAQQLLDPIFAAAQAQQAQQGDALTRALQANQDQTTSRISGLNATLGGTSAGLQQLSVLPNSAMTDLRTRALAQTTDQASGLGAQRTAMEAGLQQNLTNLNQASQLARQRSDYGAQQRAAAAAAQASQREIAQANNEARLQLAEMNTQRAEIMAQRAMSSGGGRASGGGRGGSGGMSVGDRLALYQAEHPSNTVELPGLPGLHLSPGEALNYVTSQQKSDSQTASGIASLKTSALKDYLGSFKDGQITGGDQAHPWASNQKLLDSVTQQYAPSAQPFGMSQADLRTWLATQQPKAPSTANVHHGPIRTAINGAISPGAAAGTAASGGLLNPITAPFVGRVAAPVLNPITKYLKGLFR